MFTTKKDIIHYLQKRDTCIKEIDSAIPINFLIDYKEI